METTAGATSAGGIAAVAMPMGTMQRRQESALATVPHKTAKKAKKNAGRKS